MALKFRKRIRIFPGFTLNLSKTGMSATLGVGGCSVNVGGKGSYLNVGIPGSGIYDRIKLNDKSEKVNENYGDNHQERDDGSNLIETEIKSYEPEFLTSDSMSSLKQSILDAKIVKKEMLKDWQESIASKNKTLFVLILLHFLIIGFFLTGLKKTYKKKKEFANELRADYENFSLNVSFNFDDTSKKDFDNLKASFDNMTRSMKIWDITSLKKVDKRKERTVASTGVSRLPVQFYCQSLDFIDSTVEAMVFGNANGGNLYIYPTFVVIKKDDADEFGITDLKDIHFEYSDSKFIEENDIPSDSVNLGHTWKYCNKNGSPDKRFSNNYQIPIQQYGELSITSSNGLNEAFMISNAQSTKHFFDNMSDFIKLLNEMSWTVEVNEHRQDLSKTTT